MSGFKHAKVSHIEIVVPDAHKAAAFVRDALGGQNVEENISSRIADQSMLGHPDCGCEHVLAGGVVYQFIQPMPGLTGWKEHLKYHGPSVRCICFHVDDKDFDGVVQAMYNLGCKPIPRFGCTMEDPFVNRDPYNLLYEGDGEPIDCAWFDATKQCGLNFEILKKNDQWPCHTGKRLTSDIAVFQHLEVVVPDGHKAAQFMRDVWGGINVELNISNKISDQSMLGHPDCGCEHILAGGIVFQFIQPMPGLTGWKEHLEYHGPSVRNICIDVDDEEYWPLVNDLLSRGCKPIPRYNCTIDAPFVNEDPYNLLFEGEGKPIPCAWIDAREQCGLNIEILTKNYQWPSLTGYFLW